MPYMGNTTRKASDIRRFDVTGSTSATHTLTWTAPNEQSLIVTINGVKQHEDAYSVSGTTLTLTSALISTDKLEVIGINDIGTTITPAEGSVTNDHISTSAAIATSKISGLATSATTDTTDASNISTGTLGTARLGSGTASSSTFLRGDQSWAAAGGGLNSVQTFTSSGTWTRPSGVTKVYMRIQGAGSGGAGGSGASEGPGGSSGAYCEKFLDVSSISSATITVGAAGSAGSSGGGAGGSGGASSWADGTNTISCGGGTGPSGGTAGPGAVGTTTTGDVRINGQSGGGRIGGGKGGDSVLGVGGTSNDFPVDSSGFGSGGAGANGNRAGKAGKAGVVIVQEYK